MSIKIIKKDKDNYNIITAGGVSSPLINPVLQLNDQPLATYPKGSVIFTMDYDFSPSKIYGGSWTRLDEGYALWTASSGAGDKIDAGLPDIKGYLQCLGWSDHSGKSTGAFYKSPVTVTVKNPGSGSNWGTLKINFLASEGATISGIYGNSDTVQPPAIKVYVWHKYSDSIEE